MAITSSTTEAAPAAAEPEAPAVEAPPRRRRAPTPAAEAAPEPAAAPTTGIVPSTGGGIRPTAERPGRAPATPVVRDMDAPIESWAHTGDEAAERAAEEAARRETERAARVYWPRRFELGLTPPKNQADVIILDARPGPRMYLHMMRGPRDEWPNTVEPCPRELEICPVCPPNGEHHSIFTMLLTVLNIAGYTNARTGQFVPATKEIMLPRPDDQAFFDALYAEHGTLRGVQLLMKRADKFDPKIGKPKFVGKHSDDDITAYLKMNNLYDAVLNDDNTERFPAGSLAQPFNYFDFAKKPSAADLITRYGGTPSMGSDLANQRGAGGSGQFGGGRYQPQPMQRGGGAPPSNFGGFGGGQAGGPVLDDDVPF